MVPVASLTLASGTVPRAVVLPEKKQRGQVFIAGISAGVGNQLPANVMGAWPAPESLKGSRISTVEKAFAIIKRDALAVGSRLQLTRLGRAEVVEVSGNGATVKVKTGEGAAALVQDLPGGLASLLRMLAEPWLCGLVARERSRREADAAAPAVPPPTAELTMADLLAAGTSDALKATIERKTRDMLRADRRVDLSGRGNDLSFSAWQSRYPPPTWRRRGWRGSSGECESRRGGKTGRLRNGSGRRSSRQ